MSLFIKSNKRRTYQKLVNTIAKDISNHTYIKNYKMILSENKTTETKESKDFDHS